MAKGRKTGGPTHGTRNKLTVKAKEAFELAFDDLGGAGGLAAWGEANPTDFYRLFARLIPHDVTSRNPQADLAEAIRAGCEREVAGATPPTPRCRAAGSCPR